MSELGLPLIIKPVHEGSSIGMSKVEKVEDFANAVAKATAHDAIVMAEKWITGREFTIVTVKWSGFTDYSFRTTERCGVL